MLSTPTANPAPDVITEIPQRPEQAFNILYEVRDPATGLNCGSKISKSI